MIGAMAGWKRKNWRVILAVMAIGNAGCLDDSAAAPADAPPFHVIAGPKGRSLAEIDSFLRGLKDPQPHMNMPGFWFWPPEREAVLAYFATLKGLSPAELGMSASPIVGQQIAHQWCASCHNVDAHASDIAD